jgi:transposase
MKEQVATVASSCPTAEEALLCPNYARWSSATKNVKVSVKCETMIADRTCARRQQHCSRLPGGSGLLRPRSPDTIYAWVKAFRQTGVAGLSQKPRRKEPFFPHQVTEVQDKLHQAPFTLGLPASRWSLKLIRERFGFLKHSSLWGIWDFLRRHKISYKRGRLHIHSPDPHYASKKARRDELIRLGRQEAQQHVALFCDEMSYYRQATLASDWLTHGHAPLAHRRNRCAQIAGALNVLDGKVHTLHADKITVKKLCLFLEHLAQCYPNRSIHLIWDCWPNHVHPTVLSTANELGIELVPLPTYSPWLNPIEKLWKKLKQDILHLHRHSDQWEVLQRRIQDYLNQFAQGSQELLRYVGLLFYVCLPRKQLLKIH